MKKMLMCVLTFSAMVAQPTNQLQKIFVHSLSEVNQEGIVQPGKHDISLELSKMVFYFTHDPVVLPASEKEVGQGKKMVTYLFPKTEMSSEAQSMLYKCNNQKCAYYSCTVKPVQKPVNAIEVTIVYDPKMILYQYDAFDAISNQKAVVFTFFNKQLIDRLKDMRTTILQTAHTSFQKPKIVLDCGHGGVDSGACGEYGTVEKELTLQVGQQLAHEIAQLGWDVTLTRTNDIFVALDDRTAIANKICPDMLISLHANASPNKSAHGIETFFFDNNCLKNKGYQNHYASFYVKEVSDNVGARSQTLARAIHDKVLKAASAQREVCDRKVKRGAPQVLLGSRVPAILIELGFLSHKQEALALKSQSYQQALVKGICAGIADYLGKKLL